MFSEFHSLYLMLCNKQKNINFILHLIVATQLSRGWWHKASRSCQWAVYVFPYVYGLKASNTLEHLKIMFIYVHYDELAAPSSECC